MNKKALEWHYIILMLMGAIVLIWAIFYFSGIGQQITDIIKELFNIF